MVRTRSRALQHTQVFVTVLLPLCLGLGGCQTAGRSAGPASVAERAPARAVSATDSRISPQDTLEVSVYQVPSLNRVVQVDGNGIATLPLIGPVKAGGRTVREVEAEIAAKLGSKYVNSPQVSVFVKDALGQRVTVDGAVKRPGVYPAKGDTTLMQMLAQAGGLDELADRDTIAIFRVTGEQRTSAKYSLASIRSGQTADPPVYGGDTIVVDESTARLAWRAVKDVAPVAGLAVAAVP